MQQLLIAGTIVKEDAVLRRTQGGDAVAGFSVVVDNGKDKDGNRRDGTFVDCSLWGKRGEALCQYLTKGTKVTITGRPTVREHNGKAYLGCSVNEITLQGGNSGGNGDREAPPAAGGYDQGGAPAGGMDDEIPFAAEWRV